MSAPALAYRRLLEYRLYREALPALRSCAAGGDPRAMSILGLFHALGIGVDKDLQCARGLLEQSVALGDVHGKTSLGVLLLIQAGAQPSVACYARGLELLEAAACAGSIHARVAVGGVMSKAMRH